MTGCVDLLGCVGWGSPSLSPPIHLLTLLPLPPFLHLFLIFLLYSYHTTLQNNNMRLWNPKNNIPHFDLNKDDENAILKEFFLKSSTSTPLPLDSSLNDAMLNKEYSFDSFNLYDFINTESCIESLRCTRLKIQSMELLEYCREEAKTVESLISSYHNCCCDDKKIILKELTKKKLQNIKMIEEVRGIIVEIINKSEEAGGYLEKMYKILKK